MLQKKSQNPTEAKVDWNGMKMGGGHSPAFVNREHTSQVPDPLFTLSCPRFSAYTPSCPSPTCLNFPSYTRIAEENKLQGKKKPRAYTFIYVWINETNHKPYKTETNWKTQSTSRLQQKITLKIQRERRKKKKSRERISTMCHKDGGRRFPCDLPTRVAHQHTSPG